MDMPASPPPVPTAHGSAPEAPRLAGALATIVMYFCLQLVVSGVLGGLLYLLAEYGHGLFGALGGKSLLGLPAVRSALVLATLLLAAGLTLGFIHRRWPAQWRFGPAPGLGFGTPAPGWLATAVAVGLVMPFLGGWLTEWLAHGHNVTQDIKQLGGSSPLPLRLLLAVLVASLGPLVEEVLFRGLLLSALLRWLRAPAAVALSALLFGLVHLPDFGFLWYAVPNLVLLGAALGWLRLRSDSLWPAILAHAINNLLAVGAWFGASSLGG